MSTIYSSNQRNRIEPSVDAKILRRLRRVGGSAWKAVLILLFVVFMAAPVLAVMGHAIGSHGTTTTLWTRGTRIAFRNTLVLGILVAVVSSAIAYLLAWAMVVTRLADKPLARVASLVPFMAPPYLMSIGWILFMEPNGYLTKLMPSLSGVGVHFFSLWGLVCVMSLHLFPIPFVPALQAIRTIHSKYDEPARTHGASTWYRWWRIWLPLTAPAMVGSSVLVFVKTIGEFGTPLVFGSLLHFPVLTTAVYLQMTNWPIDFHAAAQLSALLLGTVLVVWLVNDLFQRRTQFAMSSLTRTAPLARPFVRWLGMGYILVLGLVSIAIPIGSLFLTSILRIEGNGLHWRNLSLLHYRHIFSTGTDAMTAVWTSMKLGFLAATIVLAMSLALVVLARFYGNRLAKLTEWLGLLPNSIPDVLLVIGLILFWNARWWPVTPYNTQAILVVGYVVVLFPFSYNYVRAALFRLSPTVWEAALAHQASRWRTAGRIVAPLMASAMVSGWMMVFAVALRDLVVPMLLSPPNTTVISTYIYGQFDQGSLPDAMALAVVTMLMTILVLTVVQWVNTKTSGEL